MKRASILEFMLKDELFCFNTSIVEFVFELEEYEKIQGVSEYILGIAKHDDEAVLLVDTLHLYENDKLLDMQTPKSVVVVTDEQGANYGMVVDTIVQIEEVEIAPTSIDLSSEELVINHYKQQEKIINEIVPLPLLKAHNIPSFEKKVTLQHSEVHQRDAQEYLLFKVHQEFYAVPTHYVEEVVEREGEIFLLDEESSLFLGATAVRENVVRIANLDKEYTTQESELVVVEHKEQRFALLASEVLGIESFALDKIENLDESGRIAGFYNLDGEVVALVNVGHFLADESNGEITHTGVVQSASEKKEEFLLFEINGKDFAIDMKHIRQVVQVEDIATTKSSAIGVSEIVEFIAQWNNHAVDVVKLDSFLGTQTKDNGEIIMLQYGDKMSGVLVDEIDDICYVHPRDVVGNKEQNSLIDGALLQDDKVIPTLNPKQILQVA